MEHEVAGIVERLPYLRSLGVNAVWLSPVFPSPMADFGYDISNYTGIDPLFGGIPDFDALVSAAQIGSTPKTFLYRSM